MQELPACRRCFGGFILSDMWLLYSHDGEVAEAMSNQRAGVKVLNFAAGFILVGIGATMIAYYSKPENLKDIVGNIVGVLLILMGWIIWGDIK